MKFPRCRRRGVAGIARRLELGRLQDDLVVVATVQPVAAGRGAGRHRGLLAAVVTDNDLGVGAGLVADQAAELVDLPDHMAWLGGSEIEAEATDLAVVGLRERLPW